MFHQSRAISVDIGEIERRLRGLERRLERLGNQTSARTAEAADHIGERIAASLTSIAEQFRGGANTVPWRKGRRRIGFLASSRVL
jgi:hypothetical protein